MDLSGPSIDVKLKERKKERSNFWKFFLIRTSFTLGEPVSLVKVFRLFRVECIFLVFRVWTQYVDVQHLIYWQGQRVSDAFFKHWHPEVQHKILGEIFFRV
jgi:hypothetical protein